ncbi:hypothetical protein B0T14DRAFT_570375 [Immersiella caudata]|uniref:Uncharacterized protein n=1 Tax=Immersiella caudata TaxID=314043 RepID=A0AA39WFG7_9PEZI|nr:hypothetical protein B0T14DRAFT_570375 [Immersiella caudata]
MNFGNWLLRSVRGDALSESPVSVIEKLNALRPLRDVDKETLLGAVLMLGPSLQLALQMLQELLPPDESRERLGEVLCPTLWLLQNSLTDTLRSFSREGHEEGLKPEPTVEPRSARGPSKGRRPRPSPSPRPTQHREADRASSMPISLLATEKQTRPPTPPNRNLRPLEDFPALHGIAPSPGRPSRTPDSAADLALMKDLRAEMRVNAAIQVAVDSLEFAEGQLQIVKEVNRLKGGSFELLQRHFYEGYNRILFRALELERREFDSPPYAASVNEDYEEEEEASEKRPDTQHTQHSVSISFESPLALPELPPIQLPPLPPLSPARPKKESALAVDRGLPVRRNTTQGVEGPRRQQFKRRLSLAEELAMAGDESDTDEYSDDGDDDHDETPVRDSSKPESNSSSESEEEDSEDDSQEEAPREIESPVEDSGSDSEDTSVDGEDESEDERVSRTLPAPRPTLPPTLIEVVSRTVRDIKGRKQLEGRVEVISPPTSPERVPGAITGVS